MQAADTVAVTQQKVSFSAPEGDSAREHLAKAFEGDDPLASAAMVVAWLDTSTIDDFRKLAETPEKFPWQRLSGMNGDFRIALYEALAARWLDLDPEGGLSGLQKLQKAAPPINYSGPDEILNAAARLRPEIILKGLPLLSERGYLEYHTSTALQSLAGRDPNAARQFLDRFTTPETRRRAEVQIATGIVSKDPLAVISLAQQLDDPFLYQTALQAAERIGPGIVRQLVSAAGGKLDKHHEIPRLLLRNPDLAADLTTPSENKASRSIPEILLTTADQLDPAERQRILDSYDSMPSGTRESAAAALACSWARTEPVKAAEWAMAHAQPDDRNSPANLAADLVFLRWVNNDPDAATRWWSSLPPSSLRDSLGSNASTYIAENGQLDVALKMFSPGAGETDAPITTQLAQYLVDHDPPKAAIWLGALPPEARTDQAAQLVISKWYQQDPEAVARWVESLPAGPRRDGALTAFVETATKQSPEGAAEWVETVADPKLRQKAAMAVYWSMRRSDPAAAEGWIRALKGVDSEWQARFLRRLK